MGCPGSALRALFCLKTGIKRLHPNPAAFTKHPHWAARTMTGSRGWGSRRETEARQLGSAAAEREGQRHSAHAARASGFQFRSEQKSLYKGSLAHTCARPWGWRDRGHGEPGELRVGTPGREGDAGERFLARDKSGSRDSQLAGRREGTRGDAHIPRPRPTPRTKWALSAPPPPRLLEPSPQRGQGARGWVSKTRSARPRRSQPVPSRARLSGRTAPAKPSRGAVPAPGPGAQRDRLGRRTGASPRSPSGGLRPRGRCPRPAAAWAVARPGRAEDAPWLSARAPAARLRDGRRTAGRGGQASGSRSHGRRM